jgi:DNA-binding NtrC family response regulator
VARILIVDDEPKLVTLLKSALAHRGHDVTGAGAGAEALALLPGGRFDVVLTDLRMEPVDGMAVLAAAREHSPDTAVVILTAYPEVKGAVDALQQGAFHYLTKPFNFQEVAHVVESAAAAVALARENRALHRTVAQLGGGPEIIGASPATEAMRRLIAQVATSEATVLIRGESGTGKEVAARALHAASGRAAGPFIAVNCAAIAETLLESELFGYRQGAFTGADRDREGLFEAARGGTLLLDEIGEAGAAVQAKLLRVLEERKINRVGDPIERQVDVRVLAATNRPLETLISAGAFREDLYYRLLVFPLDVPPLRERLDDIPLLASHFLARLGRRETALPAAVLPRLRAHAWPGNIRELRNLVERAHILAGAGPLSAEHVQLDVGTRGRTPPGTPAPDDLDLDRNARALITEALRRAGGNKTTAASMLGITRRAMYSRMKMLGMDAGPVE